ncbi:hypothetical protein B0T22DRAFT_455460 [Podospora appendiculata]|uniref:Nucleoporin NUP53 n=1 Tax=Podospora appendiculata TaxID=314037 RepID=A0AAE1CIP3_9PEZI|nr:hypothetical protein B0T22DRAFT_455460 [Podospora appendiculata]
MPPLILHNVPDDELYIGEDGIQRPYAMVFPHQDAHLGRARKTVPETGSFGKSTRRSRSKTGTPARREDPTLAAADKVFGNWLAGQSENPSQGAPISSNATNAPSRKPLISASSSQTALDEGSSSAPAQTRFVKKHEPTEVILRGYRSSQQQYAAIKHYEQLAGRICEDYSRDPPIESRRYKSELRDPAFTRSRVLTPEERAKVNKAESGEHWIKVTFESAEAAEAAIYASPQSILGHLIYAELYHNVRPSRDEAVLDTASVSDDRFRSPPSRRQHTKSASSSNGGGGAFGRQQPAAARAFDDYDLSPPHSQTSSRTADTTTVTSNTETSTLSSATVTGKANGAAAAVATSTGRDTASQAQADNGFCRAIPTVRKAKLLPAEQALLPAPSYTQRVLNHVPFLKWFSGSMIGNEVPRTDAGDFDWDKASLYWKFIWWLDSSFGLFGREILSADKED